MPLFFVLSQTKHCESATANGKRNSLAVIIFGNSPEVCYHCSFHTLGLQLSRETNDVAGETIVFLI